MERSRHRNHRFDRAYPGERLNRDRPLTAAVFRRDRELREVRKALGESFVIREVKARRATLLVDPYPNAPLLKRIVLNPYVQPCGRGQKVKYEVGIPWDLLDREVTPSALFVYREAKVAPIQGNPVRSLEHRPSPRPPREGVDVWLQGREVA